MFTKITVSTPTLNAGFLILSWSARRYSKANEVFRFLLFFIETGHQREFLVYENVIVRVIIGIGPEGDDFHVRELNMAFSRD